METKTIFQNVRLELQRCAHVYYIGYSQINEQKSRVSVRFPIVPDPALQRNNGVGKWSNEHVHWGLNVRNIWALAIYLRLEPLISSKKRPKPQREKNKNLSKLALLATETQSNTGLLHFGLLDFNQTHPPLPTPTHPPLPTTQFFPGEWVGGPRKNEDGPACWDFSLPPFSRVLQLSTCNIAITIMGTNLCRNAKSPKQQDFYG